MEIEKIFFINIEKDRERRALLEQRLRRHFPNVPFERVAAVSAPTLHKYEAFFQDRLGERELPVDGEYPQPGTIGCFISHYLALRKVEEAWRSKRGSGIYLVLEDDCVFDRTVPRLIRKRLDRYLPPDWQAIKHSQGRSSKEDAVNRMLLDVKMARKREWRYYWGSHFVIYNGAAVPGILEKMESAMIAPFDLWLRNEVDGVYSFTPGLRIKQSNLGGSNTHPDYGSSKYEDRSLFGLAGSIMRGRRSLRRWRRNKFRKS